MTDYNAVDSANRNMDQDFRLDDINEEDKEEAEEKAERVEEYSRIVLFLMSSHMFIHELAGIASRIMHHWSSEEASYYKDDEGQESIVYRGFEITKQDTQWMFEFQDDQLYNFWDADLMMGLKDIDAIINLGELR